MNNDGQKNGLATQELKIKYHLHLKQQVCNAYAQHNTTVAIPSVSFFFQSPSLHDQ